MSQQVDEQALRAQRYGAPNPRRRPLAVALVVLLAGAGLSWLAWAALAHASPEVVSQLESFDVQGERAAEATLIVSRRDEGVEATCVLRALAVDHSAVGEQTVQVGAGDPRVATITVMVRTERRATSIVPVGCTAPGQTDPR